MLVNFVKKLEDENSYIVLGTSEIGIDCFYHVVLTPQKLKELQKIPAGTKIDIQDFGKVIEKGYGEPA